MAIWYRKNGKGDRDGNKIIKEVKKSLEELEEEKVWVAFNKKEITIKEAKSGDWGNYILVGEEMKFGNGDNTSFINSFIIKSVIIIAEVMKVVYGKNSKEE